MFNIFYVNDSSLINYNTGSIKYSKNNADILTFSILQNDKNFNNLKKYKDYINVINQLDNSICFRGRVINSKVEMNSDGLYQNTLICESVLNYLNDSRVGAWNLYPLDIPDKAPKGSIGNVNTTVLLKMILDNHNSKVEDHKKIFLGNIQVNQAIEVKTDFESSLNCIQNVICKNQNGYLIIRTENNINYLDFLSESPIKETQTIEQGINLQSIDIDDSNVNIFTRIIPFGKDGLDITSVNNGLNYVESKELVEKYGIIETVMKWDDVTIPENLLNKATDIFNNMSFNAKMDLTALDLSYINYNYKSLKLFTPIRVKNDVLDYDKVHEIVSIDLNLLNAWDTTFDLNEEDSSILDTVNSVQEQVNTTKLEMVTIGNELITKVSDSDFETYKTQTAKEIQDKVSNGDVKTIVAQNAESWGISIDGNLHSTNYSFDQNGFWIKGKDGNCELTDTYATWSDNNGDSFTVGVNGFSRTSNGVTGNLKYINFIVKRPNIKNGSIEYIQLPDNFKGKQLNKDFSVTCLWDGIDSNTDAEFREDALRNIFVKVTNYNSSTGVLAVQPGMQKIGLKTNTYFGWSNATTSSGNPVGEGSMDIVIIVSM